MMLPKEKPPKLFPWNTITVWLFGVPAGFVDHLREVGSQLPIVFDDGDSTLLSYRHTNSDNTRISRASTSTSNRAPS